MRLREYLMCVSEVVKMYRCDCIRKHSVDAVADVDMDTIPDVTMQLRCSVI